MPDRESLSVSGMGILSFLGLKRTEPLPVNSVLQQISKRAERLDAKQLAKTFVTLGGIESTLHNPDHRIIFGRRGTGKTHVLSHVSETALQNRDFAILIDLRTIGSNSYIYSDGSLSTQERATRLLRDFVSALHDSLYDLATDSKSGLDLRRVGDPIEQLGEAIQEVVVREQIERKRVEKGAAEVTFQSDASLKAAALTPSFEASAKAGGKLSEDQSAEVTEKGRPRLSVNIGSVHRSIAHIISRLDRRLWILVDEWSTVPESLQPYLADFIKRTLYPHRNVSVQIAAIEQRVNFREGLGADSIGIEIGSDAFADINLDDHLVFENDPSRSVNFFRDLLYRHFQSLDTSNRFKSARELISTAFTQEQTFRELVRACEGVPRDLINILQVAAARAQDAKISIPHIREAAKTWYERDKATYVNSNSDAEQLLSWIINEVIGSRKAKAFLMRNDVRNRTLERLFDERVMHIARRSYSTKEEPGVRYQVWKIDYGCYVDLINTSKAPTGFITEGVEAPTESSFSVPEDDLRAIRRAVLDLSAFQKARSSEIEAMQSPVPE